MRHTLTMSPTRPSLYLAASYQRKKEIHAYRATLQRMGFHITSRWTMEKYSPNIQLDEVNADELATLAMRDCLEKMDESEALVLFTQPEPVRSGHQVEFGYGLAQVYSERRFDVFVCGPKNTIFCYLPQVICVDNFEALKERLREWKKGWF